MIRIKSIFINSWNISNLKFSYLQKKLCFLWLLLHLTQKYYWKIEIKRITYIYSKYFAKFSPSVFLILANNKVNVKKFFMFLVGRAIYPIELRIAASDTHYIVKQHFPQNAHPKVFCQKWVYNEKVWSYNSQLNF